MFGFLSSKRLVIQLMLAFSLFIVGTTLTLGLPVTWLFQQQTENHTQSLLDQAAQTTFALLQNNQSQLENLALLIAERPTLGQLVAGSSPSGELLKYLEDILDTSDSDVLIVCSSAGQLAATSLAGEEICSQNPAANYMIDGDTAWLFATAQINPAASEAVWIVVGQKLDTLLNKISQQSGLDYALLADNKLATTNLEIPSTLTVGLTAEILPGQILKLDPQHPTAKTHIAESNRLAETPDLKLVSLLNVEADYANNRQMIRLIVGGLVGISALGALVAVMISRRISQPLNQLAQAAAALRGGDLNTPLWATSKVWEVDQLTNALEDARVSLKHSLDQLHKEKTWVENLLNSIVEGLLTVDDRGCITFASAGVTRITGIASELLVGESIDTYFIPTSGEDKFSSQLPAPNQSRRVSVPLNGRETLLAISASQFVPPEAGNANLALVIRDVSDEERIHRMMGEFMANITHEFRTPLAALAASVELLVEQSPDLTPDEIVHLLNALNIGVINLQALIDNLLESASIEAGRFKVSPHPVELNKIIQDAVNTVRPILEKYELNIKYPQTEKSLLVLADQRRTCQAVVNLLSNAIKHSPEHGVIEITTMIADQKAWVEVSDQGEGVPSHYHKQLFHRFTAPVGEDGASSGSGFGLGLSVVKAIIEAQYGEVGITDHDQEGAHFWFTIPLAKADTA